MPSKKISILLVLAVLFAGWFLFLKDTKDTSFTYNKNTEAAMPAGYMIDANKDSDSDSLKDWEEILWSTNPYTKDTDNDGLTDDVEITEWRKTGIAPASIAKTTTGSIRNLITQTFPYGSTDANVDTNASKNVMEQFMQEYLKEKYQEQVTGTPIDEDKLTSTLFEGLKNKIEKERAPSQNIFISKNDITILPESSPTLTRDYLNDLGMIFLTANAPDIGAYDIIKEIAEQDDKNLELNVAHIRQLREHSLLYFSYATHMRDMRVPAKLAGAHIDMMNSFIRTSVILEDVMRVEFDPLKGFAAVGAYVDEIKRSGEPLKVFVNEIKQQKLLFADTEGGIIFAQFTSKL